MARQIPELDELLGNYIADEDLILVRDMSAKQDKRATMESLANYILGGFDTSKMVEFQNLPDIDNGKFIISKTSNGFFMQDLKSVYPVGSVVKTKSSSFDPEVSIGGQWEKIINGEKERIYRGSQVKFAEVSGSVNSTTTSANVIGSYNYAMLSGAGGTPPVGYHMAYRISCQGYSSGNGWLQMRLNNILTSKVSTWSGETMRNDGWSDYFTQDDVTLEPTLNYTGTNGINIGWIRSASGGTVSFKMWHPTLHFYWESDDVLYVWRRTS